MPPPPPPPFPAATGPGEDEAGWAAPPPPPGAGPSEDQPGWAAPPPPGGYPPPGAAGLQGTPPPPPPFPAPGVGSGYVGSRRRKASWIGGIAALVVFGSRALFSFQSDDSSSSLPNFDIPSPTVGRPVTATPLTSDEVCALLAPSDLRPIYDRRFEQGEPLATGSSTGEPSAAADDEIGACTWRTQVGEERLTLTAISIPSIGGDANQTFDFLRPGLAQGFDADPGSWDEAFFVPDSGVGTSDAVSDSMTLRSGGVVLQLNVTSASDLDGSLDALSAVATAAVGDLPANP